MNAGIKPGAELPVIFRLLDRNGNGQVSQTEFCDIVEARVAPDYKAFVKSERALAAKEEEKKLQERQFAANMRSQGADIGSNQESRH
jgi:Ca2+-binding EF-hand superfamily protein